MVKEGGHPIHHHHLSICLSFFPILHFTGQRSIATRAVNFCLILLCRYNARGFDLNRNFPDYFKQNTKRLQPETEAYKEWIAKIQFTLSAGLHAGALVASYPFDNTPNSGKSSSPVSIVTTYIYKLINQNSNNGSCAGPFKSLPSVHVDSVTDAR